MTARKRGRTSEAWRAERMPCWGRRGSGRKESDGGFVSSLNGEIGIPLRKLCDSGNSGRMSAGEPLTMQRASTAA